MEPGFNFQGERKKASGVRRRAIAIMSRDDYNIDSEEARLLTTCGSGLRIPFIDSESLVQYHARHDLCNSYNELIENVLTNYNNSSVRCVSPPHHPSETCMPPLLLKSVSCSQHAKLQLFITTPPDRARVRLPRALYTSFLAYWITGDHTILYTYIFVQAL